MKLDFSEIRAQWTNLPPSTKKKGLFVSIGLIVVIVYLAMPDSAPQQQAVALKEGNTKSVFSPTDTRAVGMDGIAVQLKDSKKELSETKGALVEIQKQLKELKDRRGETTDVQQQVGMLNRNLTQISEALKQQGFRLEDLETGKISVVKNETPDPREEDLNLPSGKPKVNQPVQQRQSDNIFERDAATTEDSEGKEKKLDKTDASISQSGAKKLVFTESSVKKQDDSQEDLIITVPIGTIMSTVAITGVSAAAGPKASSAPFPMTLRVRDVALMPNNHTVDLSDCMVSAAVFGELSSERVQGRTERISCIDTKGTIYSGDLKGYLVGEDSKAGIKGTLVRRTGSLIANSLIAGIGQGISTALDQQAIPTINTNGKQQYQTFDSKTLQHGVSQGTGNAFQEVSKYYMDLAEQIFPVVEISGGRNVDLVLNDDLRLKPLKKANANKEMKNEVN